ncbi:hypothetical protein CVT24_007239 [Panaeolus cyanescens]|uniref:Uncharacterized protein n=1 Tax=Panaeolus cyanescens TaxID=181874 RepID=A0A409YPC9_9AGAR|nr:hypothetical protein CVT24_007239 [Panaeolus cyanescens]
MPKLTDDPELTTEMLTMMGKELKQARQRIKDLESFKEAYTANDVLSPNETARLRDFRERTNAAEAAMEVMQSHVENVNKENYRLKEEIKKLQCQSVVKREVTESVLAPLRDYRDQGVSADNLQEENEHKTQIAELEAALERYYSKYVASKKARTELETKNEHLNSTLTLLEMKHKDMMSQVESAVKEKEIALNSKASYEAQLKIVSNKIETLKNESVHLADYHSLFPAVIDIGRPVALSPPESEPVCFLGVDLGAYLETDPRTASYSKSVLYSPDLLQFPDNSGRSALWLRPLFEFDGRYWSSWTTNTSLRPPLGRDFTVFYPKDGYVLYAGQYTVAQIFPRGQNDAGYLITTDDPEESNVVISIAQATLKAEVNNSRFHDVQRLYTGGVAQVGVVALKFVSFNQQLHDILAKRFRASLPVKGSKRKEKAGSANPPSAGKAKGPPVDGDSHRDKRQKK